MIPRQHHSDDGNDFRRSSKTNRGNGGLPYLQAKDASATPQPAKVISARMEKDAFRAGNQVLSLRVLFREHHWLVNLRMNNPNLTLLCDAWGEDESTWTGNELSIFTERDKHNENLWLRFDATKKIVKK